MGGWDAPHFQVGLRRRLWHGQPCPTGDEGPEGDVSASAGAACEGQGQMPGPLPALPHRHSGVWDESPNLSEPYCPHLSAGDKVLKITTVRGHRENEIRVVQMGRRRRR